MKLNVKFDVDPGIAMEKLARNKLTSSVYLAQ